MVEQRSSTRTKDDAAQRRRETSIVKRYLAHVERQQQGVGGRTSEEIQVDIDQVELALDSATDINRLDLLQQRENLNRELLGAVPQNDDQLEEQFITVAKSYAERKDISYTTWREFGVPKQTLERANIARTRRPNRQRQSGDG